MHVYYSKDRRKYSEMNYEGKYLLDPKYMTKRDLRHYYRYYNMTKNRSQFKKIIVIIFCICFFCYIFIDYNLKTKIIQLRDRFDFVPRVDANYTVTQAYFVNTPGCRMPYFAAVDENIVQYMYRPKRITCGKSLTRTSDIGASIIINMSKDDILRHYNLTDLRNARCYYREIIRENDQKNSYSKQIPFKLAPKSSINIQPGIELIVVNCSENNSQSFYSDYHFFILNKQNASRNFTTKLAENSSNSNESESIKSKSKVHWGHLNPNLIKTTAPNSDKPEERISVMLLGFDSVSHLNFLRQMQKTAAFIHQNLTHVEFWGYNKVADDTFPNIIPTLVGLDVDELKLACMEPGDDMHLDKCNLIWKRFKEAGYQTAYGEDIVDNPSMGRNRFMTQPTDYYLYTIIKEMYAYFESKKSPNKTDQFCLGERRSVDVLLEFIRKLIPYLKIQNFFSFFWSASLTHEQFNWPTLLDDDITHILKLFDQTGIFNKTVMFLMSDHGLRWGSFRETYQGMAEERLPLLIALYPSWFRQKYATAINNMELNTKRLTTPFDFHATLLDLLDLRNLEESNLHLRASNIAEAETLPRGISLFLPIPITRTCEQAGLASHWCLCHHREELPTTDARVQRAARYLIKIINDRLKGHPQCRTLYLNSILDARIAAPHQKIIKDVTHDYSIDVSVRIQTKPGMGLFESTVRMSSYTIGLTGTISRINLYGSQSYCVNVKEVKMFCYCHR